MTIRIAAAAALAAAAAIALPAAADDLRVLEELHRADLTGVEGMEVITVRQTLKPGAHIPLHTHHGDEHAVILKGAVLTTDGGKEIPFKDGLATHFPRGKVHGGLTNNTGEDLVMINTYIVDKGKPLATPAK